MTTHFPLPRTEVSLLLASGPCPLLLLTRLPTTPPILWAETLLLSLARTDLEKKHPSGQTLKPARMHPSPSICETADTLHLVCLVILPRTTGCKAVLLLARKKLCRKRTTALTACRKALRCRPTVLTNYRVELSPRPINRMVLPTRAARPVPPLVQLRNTLVHLWPTCTLGTFWPPTSRTSLLPIVLIIKLGTTRSKVALTEFF